MYAIFLSDKVSTKPFEPKSIFYNKTFRTDSLCQVFYKKNCNLF